MSAKIAKQQKRDKVYYEKRLLRDHPVIYADYAAGKYRTVSEAFVAAGLKKPRTRLHELKNAWQKASANERREFENWLHAQYGITTPHPVTASSTIPPIAIDRRLSPWAKSRIRAIIAKRHMRKGDVMHEMGFKKLNASLGMALDSDNRLQPAVLIALEAWLNANKHI